MENCLFCKIVKGIVPSEKVYEDEEILAFKDIYPIAPVHILVIPKQHIATLSDSTHETAPILGRMLALAPQLAQQAGCGIQKNEGAYEGGYKVMINAGPEGGQEIYHLHMHIIGGPKPWKKI